MKLTKEFFEKPTIEVAKELLGCYLINEINGKKVAGKIVETEAYLENDPGSHSANGMTKRNEQMFKEPGTAYVYFTYGMYYCFNVVTNSVGKGEAVLIRALEPLEGIEIMKKNRSKENTKELCSGPAKLVIAMGITKQDNGKDLINGKLGIEVPEEKEKFEIVETTRIGISRGAELKYRFYIKDNEFVSRR